MLLKLKVSFKFRSLSRMVLIIFAIALTFAVLTESAGLSSVPTVQDYIELEAKCVDILDISNDLRAQISHHHYPDTPESHRLTYCLGALFYGYSDQAGLDMDMMYTIYGQGESRQEFDREKERCMEENGAFEPGLNKYAKVYRKYECFAVQYENIFE